MISIDLSQLIILINSYIDKQHNLSGNHAGQVFFPSIYVSHSLSIFQFFQLLFYSGRLSHNQKLWQSLMIAREIIFLYLIFLTRKAIHFDLKLFLISFYFFLPHLVQIPLAL